MLCYVDLLRYMHLTKKDCNAGSGEKGNERESCRGGWRLEVGREEEDKRNWLSGGQC